VYLARLWNFLESSLIYSLANEAVLDSKISLLIWISLISFMIDVYYKFSIILTSFYSATAS
jgi:hypothetical protein